MSGFLWNIRGLNKTSKHSVITEWIKRSSFDFGCILETRVKEKKVDTVKAKLNLGWSLISNYEHHPNGRIWVLWSDAVRVTPVFKSSQLITCLVELGGDSCPFYCSFVYASNLEEERRDLWRDLLDHKSSFLFRDNPWWIGGDFNEVLKGEEHSLSLPMESYVGMHAFQHCVRDCELIEMASQGPNFTWCNRRKEGLIYKRLDRSLVNELWNSVFPHSYVFFESGGCSDHLRGRFYLQDSQVKKKNPFKFSNVLVLFEQFKPLLKDFWSQQAPLFVSTTAMHRLSTSLKALKGPLRELGRTHLHQISNQVSEAYDDLRNKQQLSFNHPGILALEAELMAYEKWENLSLIEENFLRQRSKLHWLSVGDKNNRFFHNSIKERQRRNMIHELIDRNGVRIIQPSSIKNEAVFHFNTFLNETPATYEEIAAEELETLIDFRCNLEDRQLLMAPVTSEEIKSVLFGLPHNKAPGPDGYTVEFFIAAWDILGKDFTTAVHSFFQRGFLPKGVNSTILALVPKKDNASTMKDYRPISLCNVIYKVISRILASRLKLLLPNMIASNQSAFVPKRLLMENVLLATEIVKDYHKETVSPRCSMKIDISKAFDSVQWPFLFQVLRVMNLPEEFIHWLELCVTTSSFSVQVNGELAGYFGSSRGLRQGCSLSPYLFVICMNVLSTLLDRGAKDRLFGYHPRCKNIGLTHLCFADDLLIFVEGRRSSIDGVVSILDRFSRMSGLLANLEKSSLFIAGVNGQHRTDLQSSLPFVEGILPIRYLGLPLLPRRLMVEDYSVLVERIRGKLCSWKGRFLSYAGRFQLIASVIYGMINFWQACFHLPAACLRELEGLCSAFLWSGPDLNPNNAKIAWETVCTPKEEGGLGLRRFKETSRVCCLKLIWRLVSSKDSLWSRWVKSCILKGRSFWEARNTSLGSWIYKKLQKYRSLAKNLHRVDIRSGHGTSFWYDVWSDLGCLYDLTGARGVIDMGITIDATVADALSSRRRRRYRTYIYRKIDEITQSVAHREGEDIHLWQKTIDRHDTTFSSSHTWRLIRHQGNRVAWYRLVWFPQATPKFAFIFWLACWNRLSTMDRIRIWNNQVDDICILCGEFSESRDHLFFECVFSAEVWKHIIGNLMGSSIVMDWNSIHHRLLAAGKGRVEKFLCCYATQAVVYSIWMERNNRRHGAIPQSKEVLIKIIDKGIRNKISVMRSQGHLWMQDGMQFWFRAHS